MRIRLSLAKAFVTTALFAAMLFGSAGPAAAGGTSAPGPMTPNGNQHPRPTVDAKYYMLLVDKEKELLTVLRQDASGGYTIIDRQFVCSTGRTPGRTPLGNFRIGQKYRWRASREPYNEYMQYCSRVEGFILIHSVPYLKMNENTLVREGYLDLGKPVSAGCIRLVTRDAKWVYQNCPTGTAVKIVKDGGPQPVCVTANPPLADGTTTDPTDELAVQ